MAKRKPLKSERGFTIVELLIATSVFGVVLLIVTTGIIKIGQSYYKGIIQSRTQEANRNIAEDISRSFQFANGTKRDGGDNKFCVGNVRYTYYLNQQVGNGVDGLISEKIAPDDACSDTSVGSDRRELLGGNMRLLKFDVTSEDDQSKTWKIDIRLAYGDDDLLSHYNNEGVATGWDPYAVPPGPNVPVVANANCKSGIPGGSFCATSQLDILVKKRLN